MSTGKVVLGLLAGIAAGATLGILFAPDKGEKTRTRIRKRGDDYFDNLKARFNDAVDSFNSKASEVENELDSAIDKGRRKAQEVKNTVSDKIQSA